MFRDVLTTLLSGALLVGVACSAGEPRDEAQLGARVVSLSPSITRVVLRLGAGESLVGVDRYSKRVAELGDVPSLGALFNPDIERTLELKPTLVVAVRSAAQQAFFDQLRSRGIRVEELAPYTLEEVLQSFQTLGSLLDREREAVALVAAVRAEMAEVAESVQALPRRSVVVVLEHDPLYVVGGGNFVNALIDAAGGVNVFADIDAPYPQVSLEALAARKPEIVLDTVFNPLAAADTEAAPQRFWQRFPWVKRVETLRKTATTLPGPELAEGARELRAKIHPELAGLVEP